MKTGTLLLLGMIFCARPAFAQVDSLASPADTTAVRPVPAKEAIDTVQELETIRHAAMVRADTKTLANFFAEDATYTHSNGLTQTRSELFSVLERRDIRYLSFETDDVRYREYNRTVVGTGVQRLEVQSAGKSVVLRSRYTVVYAELASGWKLVAYQSTATPEMEKRP